MYANDCKQTITYNNNTYGLMEPKASQQLPWPLLIAQEQGGAPLMGLTVLQQKTVVFLHLVLRWQHPQHLTF